MELQHDTYSHKMLYTVCRLCNLIPHNAKCPTVPQPCNTAPMYSKMCKYEYPLSDTCTHAHINTCTQIKTWTKCHVRNRANMHIHTHTRPNTRTHTDTHAYMQTCNRTTNNPLNHLHKQTCARAHAHTHTHSLFPYTPAAQCGPEPPSSRGF
jgi:hypothetical protein